MRARQAILAPLAAAIVLASPPASADRLPPLSHYVTIDELRKSHPVPAFGPIYHDWHHSLGVRRMAWDFARARGLSPADARFVSEVALLHDWDPIREPGTIARVDATLRLLRQDFAGLRPLIPGHRGRSVLRERFGWTRDQLEVALVMIQRSRFPFDRAAQRAYRRALARLGGDAQRFALREGALLAEVDKASFPAMVAFGRALRRIDGLEREYGLPRTKLSKDTADFIGSLGKAGAFAADRAVARSLGIAHPGLTGFRGMPRRYLDMLRANRAGYLAYRKALTAGAGVGRARRLGAAAARGR